jgi:hypothetical protein
MKFANQKSTLYNPELHENPIKFAHAPTLSISDFKAAAAWKVENFQKRCIKVSGNNEPLAYVSVSKSCYNAENLTMEVARQIFTKFTLFSWATWDEYVSDMQHNVCVITYLEGLKRFTCTCKKYAKEFKCVHSVTLAMHHKLVDIPKEATVIYFSKKSRPGRPAKVLGQWSIPGPRLQNTHQSSSSSGGLLLPSQLLETLTGDNVGNLHAAMEEAVSDHDDDGDDLDDDNSDTHPLSSP